VVAAVVVAIVGAVAAAVVATLAAAAEIAAAAVVVASANAKQTLKFFFRSKLNLAAKKNLKPSLEYFNPKQYLCQTFSKSWRVLAI
jgi:hypothetical protein